MMKLVIILILSLVLNLAVAIQAITPDLEEQRWIDFKVKFGKNYEQPLEDRARFATFKENVAKIELHNEKYNSGLSSYGLGVTKFADMTHEEFVSLLTYNASKRHFKNMAPKPTRFLGAKAPSEVDWTKVGAVTPVKDQQMCGSCWSFSATGALEGQYFLNTNRLIPLSEQNLVDCSYQYNNHGCDGGLMSNAFQYVHDNGIMTEASYPYDGIDNACAYNSSEIVFKISSYVDVQSGSESELEIAVASIGPISVAVDALNFAFYAEGIFDDDKCCNSELCLSHGILAVGYGTSQDGIDYWLVKNSWGTSWGEEGYIRMSRNKNNQCGIATDASYPVL